MRTNEVQISSHLETLFDLPHGTFSGHYEGLLDLVHPDDQDAFAERFPDMLRQDPGLDNALGLVKFMMPNGFSVYLHDTPQQQLFARRTRTFSSGCIRLEKPMELAAYLLKDEPGWNPLRIDEVVYSGEAHPFRDHPE